MNEELTKTMDEQVKNLLAQIKQHVAEGEERSGEKIKALEARVDEILDKMREEWAKHLSAFSVPGSAEATHKGEKFSYSKLFYAVMTKEYDRAPLEMEICKAAKEKAQKVMQTSPDSSGGFLVPSDILQDQIIPLLYAESVAMKLGAMDLSGLRAIPTMIPRVSGGTTAYWVGEGSTITASDLTLANISLTPKTLATLTSFTDLLSSVGVPSIDNMLKQDMARQAALKLDLAVLKGTGTGGQPTGILNTTGISTNALDLTTAGALYDDALETISAVRGNNALNGKLGWALSNGDMLNVEKYKDLIGGSGGPQQPTQRRTLLEIRDGVPYFMGYRVEVSTQLADGAGETIFGNWADAIVAGWGGMKVDTTNAVGFTQGVDHIRTMQYADVGVRHPESFCTTT